MANIFPSPKSSQHDKFDIPDSQLINDILPIIDQYQMRQDTPLYATTIDNMEVIDHLKKEIDNLKKEITKLKSSNRINNVEFGSAKPRELDL